MKQIIVLKKNSAAVCVHRGFGPIRKTSTSHPEAEGRLHRGLRSSMSEMHQTPGGLVVVLIAHRW